MLSNKSFISIIILIVLITLTILFVIVYYTAYTSAPSTLHSTFTTQKGPITDFILNMESQNSKMQAQNVISTDYKYEKDTSWILWRYIRLTSYLSGKHKPVELSANIVYEDIMGSNQNKIPRKMGMVYHNRNEKITILTFHGTSNPADWRTDMDLKLVKNTLQLSDKGEKIHHGFLNRYIYMKSNLEKIIQKYNALTKDRGWFIAGHSLGGAIATLVAYDQNRNFTSQPHIYTYGQPRVGNDNFAKKMNKMYEYGAYRVVNSSDIISFLPPPIWFNKNYYEHAFEEHQFTLNLEQYSNNHILAYEKYLSKEN